MKAMLRATMSIDAISLTEGKARSRSSCIP
jgi:hypothetical protein